IRERAKPRRRVVEPSPIVRELQPGDRVQVRDIPQTGEAISTLGEDGRVEVQFGGLRMKVSVDRITSVQPPSGGERVRLPEPTGPAVSPELDLRGQRAEEALLSFET